MTRKLILISSLILIAITAGAFIWTNSAKGKADLPEGEKAPPHVPGLLGAEEARQVYGDGVFGSPYQADDAIMGEIFAAALGDVVHLLRFE
ncbi:MAG: hypothetical protein KKD28_04130 [Chloroflexi bacterium]|nr:hypothetical protein [Chloroflexota bacterium]MBU1660641.1 hypothetical protein [Chloroflexota bacterium]